MSYTYFTDIPSFGCISVELDVLNTENGVALCAFRTFIINKATNTSDLKKMLFHIQ